MYSPPQKKKKKKKNNDEILKDLTVTAEISGIRRWNMYMPRSHRYLRYTHGVGTRTVN